MGTLGEAADNHQDKITPTVEELGVIDTSMVIVDREMNLGDNGVKPYKAILMNDKEYRVPLTVLAQIKNIRANNNKITKFKVTAKGTGLKKQYTVTPVTG